jgi:hypothetical protein
MCSRHIITGIVRGRNIREVGDSSYAKSDLTRSRRVAISLIISLASTLISVICRNYSWYKCKLIFSYKTSTCIYIVNSELKSMYLEYCVVFEKCLCISKTGETLTFCFKKYRIKSNKN